jgi:hypothetical protein
VAKDLTPVSIFTSGLFCMTDVSITHPNAPSIRRNAASAPGRAAEIRATSKTNKYATEARNAGQEFLALVLETYGG